jgi:hypothetical protein
MTKKPPSNVYRQMAAQTVFTARKPSGKTIEQASTGSI